MDRCRPNFTMSYGITRQQCVKNNDNSVINICVDLNVLHCITEVHNVYAQRCARPIFTKRASYHKISWSLKAARLWFKLFQWRWPLKGTSIAALSSCQSNFKALRHSYHPVSRLLDLKIIGSKTHYRSVNRGAAGSQVLCLPPAILAELLEDLVWYLVQVCFWIRRFIHSTHKFMHTH